MKRLLPVLMGFVLLLLLSTPVIAGTFACVKRIDAAVRQDAFQGTKFSEWKPNNQPKSIVVKRVGKSLIFDGMDFSEVQLPPDALSNTNKKYGYSDLGEKSGLYVRNLGWINPNGDKK